MSQRKVNEPITKMMGGYVNHFYDYAGGGAMNRLKHLLRAYKCRDWHECDKLVALYTDPNRSSTEKMYDMCKEWFPGSDASNKRRRSGKGK